MERYFHLQAMPNSPLAPLTPLNENTEFKFNFYGDGSLDHYIDSVRKEHIIEQEQQQQKMLEEVRENFRRLLTEAYEHLPNISKTPVLKIPHACTPLKPKNHNVEHQSRSHQKQSQQQSQLKRRSFGQSSPVATKPLCPKVARILQQNGLSIYSELFQKHDMDLILFHLLTIENLRRIGITSEKGLSALMFFVHSAEHISDNIIREYLESEKK